MSRDRTPLTPEQVAEIDARAYRALAHHEAGHAVAATVLYANLERVVLAPEGTGEGGQAVRRSNTAPLLAERPRPTPDTPLDPPEGEATPGPIPPELAASLTMSAIRKSIMTTVAGPIADAIYRDEDVDEWAGNASDTDWQTIHEMLALIDATEGERLAVLTRWKVETEITIREHWPAVERVAEALIEHGELDRWTVYDLVHDEGTNE